MYRKHLIGKEAEMLVSPVSSKSIYFTANNINAEVAADEALLMLQDPKSAVLFKKNQENAMKAASRDPLTALGYKLYNTFRYLTNANLAEAEASKQNEKFIALA